MTESGVPPQEPEQPQQPPQPPTPPPLPTPPPPQQAPPPPQQPPGAPQSISPSDPHNLGPTQSGVAPHVAGLLCYLFAWVSGLIFLLIEPRNKFVRFHAMQSLVLFGALTAIDIVLGATHLIWTLGGIVNLVWLVCWILGMVNAYGGKWFKFPVVGDYAERAVQQMP